MGGGRPACGVSDDGIKVAAHPDTTAELMVTTRLGLTQTPFSSPLLDALDAIHKKYECTHENLTIVRRTHKDGSRHYVRQCDRCGRQAHQALPEPTAYALSGGKEPPPLDEGRYKAWCSARRDEIAVAEAKTKKLSDAEYNRYLASPEWAAKRKLVLARSRGMCEGCGVARATDVHHLSYLHRYDEFLFELLAVCRSCHLKLHPERPGSDQEPERGLRAPE